MDFNRHSNLEGLHSAFPASSPAWLRYDDAKTIESYQNKQAADLGTKLHAWAKQTIDLAIKQPKSKKTLYNYVNDAIGFQMNTEVVLMFSKRFFGTADAISFRNGTLRIHDLKTGKTPVHIDQLRLYAAYFCKEYCVDPKTINIELRIYQNDDVYVEMPSPELISDLIDIVEHKDKLLEKYETDKEI